MKKRLQFILAGALIALLAVGIAACKSGEERLSAPANLQVSEDDILTWDEVEGAKSYVVLIGEEEYEAKTNTLDIFLLTTESKTYEIKVAAYNADYRLTEWSNPVTYAVPVQPEFKFQLTDDGTGYQIRPSGATVTGEIFGRPIIKYDGKAYGVGKVIVPSSYNGKPVKELAINAFNECEGLTGLILPDAVEAIGGDAFHDCKNLRRIRLPAFIETIESDSFFGCEALKEISLPEGLRKIESGAFMGCESLEKIEIPSAVERIDLGVFELCRNLKSLTVAEGNPTFRSEGNCVIRKSDDALIMGCNASVIPQGVTSIGDYAFSECRELKEIKIPASVTKIEYGAFAYCSALEKLELSDGLKELNGSSIFRNCKNLKSLNIPRTVEKIEVHGRSLFDGTRFLSLTVDEENPYYYSDGNCIIRKSDGVLVAGCDSSVIPDYVEEIGSFAFAGCKMDKISLPAGLKKIGISAFEGCPLTQLSLPAGLKTIGISAFAGCPLTHLYIPESVESIGGGAFDECALRTVILPGSVKTIDIYAFSAAFDIYTSAEEEQDGWLNVASVWYGSAQKDEDGLFYVHSITVKKYKNGGISNVPFFDPYREGYVFKGWTTVEGGTEPLFERTLLVTEVNKTKYERYVYLTREQAKTLPEGKTVLYAIWEKA